MNLENFAPDVNVQDTMDAPAETAEVSRETETTETPADTKVDTPETTEVKEQKTVPIVALHEARKQNQELKARYEEVERQAAERYAALEKRLDLIANPPKTVPTFEENPAEHLRQQTEELRANQKRIDEERAEREKQFTRQTQEQQALQTITTKMLDVCTRTDGGDLARQASMTCPPS